MGKIIGRVFDDEKPAKKPKTQSSKPAAEEDEKLSEDGDEGDKQ